MPVISNDDHHVGDIRSYLLKIHEETPLIKSLVAELKTITRGVDPDEGYANTLMNLANRMQMNEAVLVKELGIDIKGKTLTLPVTSKASISFEMFPLLTVSRRDYRDFL
jgi:hypothetical protein